MILHTPSVIDHTHVTGQDLVPEDHAALEHANFSYLDSERPAPATRLLGRPAENTALIASLATLISLVTGAPHELSIALATIAGLGPHLASLVVDHGGIRGIARLLWRGRS